MAFRFGILNENESLNCGIWRLGTLLWIPEALHGAI